MISICSVGFASLDLVCDELNDSARNVISTFKRLRVGSQMFVLLMLFLCVIVHNRWSCKSLKLLCILPFGMLYLSAISMMFVKYMLAVCMLVGMVV